MEIIKKSTDSCCASICDYCIIGFAAWTVTSNITTLTGGSLLRLLFSFGFFSFLFFFYLWIRKKRQKIKHILPVALEKGTEVQEGKYFQNYLLWTLVVVAVCLTLIAHRPDADDAAYINRAVAAVDKPHIPILYYDTRHLIPNALIILPVTKVVSIEMLAAALSFLTRIPVIYIFHLLFPALAAILVILAYGELFRILAPKHWIYGVLAVFVFLCANGDVHATYGNFSFVRLHQGKGVFVSAILPLLITYGLRFALCPDVRNWLLLSGAQIAAIGTTSTALFVAPIVSSLAVLTGLPRTNTTDQFKRVLLGFAASAYVVGLGIYIKLNYQIPAWVSTTNLTSVQLLDNSVKYVFGYGRFAAVCLFITLTAWFFCETRLARRLCLVFPLCTTLLFANPLVAGFLAKNLTGVRTYWRVFWLLPLPTMVGLILLFPLSTQKFHLSVSKRYVIYCLLLFTLWIVFPERHIFSNANYTRIDVPGLKVPPEYQIARLINEVIVHRPNVLAPESVTAWLTTMHKHPYPLLSRQKNAHPYADEGQRRLALKLYITGSKRPTNTRQFFQKGLQHYQVAGVCFPLSNPWAEEIRSVLRESGFRELQDLLSYEIWIIPESHSRLP